jgi:hypothetical protein
LGVARVRFPDDVTILRATKADAYGNPHAAGWVATGPAVKGAVLGLAALFLPPSVDIRPADRITTHGALYAVKNAPTPLGPPGKRVMWAVSLERLPDGA